MEKTNDFKLKHFSDLYPMLNSGKIKPINVLFKKLTNEMFKDVLKEINRKSKKNKTNLFVTNSQIYDELFTWEIII